MNRLAPKPDCANIIGLVKGAERYSVTYGDSADDRRKALRALGLWASNPELSFTWHDAAVLSLKVRRGT